MIHAENSTGPVIVENFINGKFALPADKKSLKFFNPAQSTLLGECPASQASEIEAACLAASTALPRWSNLPQRERSAFLFRIADLLEENLEEFARAESQNTGKPLALCRHTDIPRAALNLRFFAELANQWGSDFYQGTSTLTHQVLRQPLGVVACISPWNLPLYLFTWKMAPALSVGNCVIAKPSEVTPLSAGLFGKLCVDAGLPPGVLNIVHGSGTDLGTSLCTHPAIKAISFTGSTATGRNIATLAAPHFKKTSLEMGGKNSSIVFESADLHKSAQGVLKAAFLNQGQICLCGSRILVQSSIYEKFKAHLLEEIKNWKVGPPEEADSKMGALVSQAHFEKVSQKINEALERGATILCGAKRINLPAPYENGLFYAPTLLENLSNEDSFNQEEIFGPVATLQKFETEEEAIFLSNQSPYGLSASIWTNDLNQSHRLSQKLEVGMLWVNTWMARDLRTPFGGVKNSGLGREGGLEALRFFTEAKTVSIQYEEV